MWKAQIQVTLKEGVFDPSGNAAQQEAQKAGYNVEGIRIGKYLEFVVKTESRAEAEAQVERLCRELLVNTVLEQYSYQLVEVL